MKFEDAILRSIKAYRSGRQPDELIKAVGELKYTQKFFDGLEERMMAAIKKSKKKSKEMEMENGE